MREGEGERESERGREGERGIGGGGEFVLEKGACYAQKEML